MEIPFKKIGQMLTVLSFGAGQDSTAILYKLVYDKQFRKQYIKGKLIVIFSDTLNEHDPTYKHIVDVKLFCVKNKIEFYHLLPKDWNSKSWNKGLVGHYEEYKTVGSKVFFKSCSEQLKIRPIYNFLEKYLIKEFNLKDVGKKKSYYEYFYKFGKVRVLLGIGADEGSRINEKEGH